MPGSRLSCPPSPWEPSIASVPDAAAVISPAETGAFPYLRNTSPKRKRGRATIRVELLAFAGGSAPRWRFGLVFPASRMWRRNGNTPRNKQKPARCNPEGAGCILELLPLTVASPRFIPPADAAGEGDHHGLCRFTTGDGALYGSISAAGVGCRHGAARFGRERVALAEARRSDRRFEDALRHRVHGPCQPRRGAIPDVDGGSGPAAGRREPRSAAGPAVRLDLGRLADGADSLAGADGGASRAVPCGDARRAAGPPCPGVHHAHRIARPGGPDPRIPLLGGDGPAGRPTAADRREDDRRARPYPRTGHGAGQRGREVLPPRVQRQLLACGCSATVLVGGAGRLARADDVLADLRLGPLPARPTGRTRRGFACG